MSFPKLPQLVVQCTGQQSWSNNTETEIDWDASADSGSYDLTLNSPTANDVTVNTSGLYIITVDFQFLAISVEGYVSLSINIDGTAEIQAQEAQATTLATISTRLSACFIGEIDKGSVITITGLINKTGGGTSTWTPAFSFLDIRMLDKQI